MALVAALSALAAALGPAASAATLGRAVPLGHAAAARGLLAPADAGDELIAWASGEAGFVVNVALASFSEGRGLTTTGAVRKGDVLLFIPQQHMVGAEGRGAGAHAIAGRLLEEVEKGVASDHWAYIRAMPSRAQQPRNLPSLPPPLAALMAAYSDGLPGGGASRLNLAKLRQKINDGLRCKDDVGALFPQAAAGMAAWACSMALSREFSTQGGGNEFWPIADMQNHAVDKSATGTTNIATHNGISGHGIVADRDYVQGEQVYDFYGLLSNVVLVSQYGMSIEGNEIGTIDVINLGVLAGLTGAVTPMPWLAYAPRSSPLRGCSLFLSQARMGSDPFLRMKINHPVGFEPIALDCARIARYGFADMDAFSTALAAREFLPMSAQFQQAASAPPTETIPAAAVVSEEQRRTWIATDNAVFNDMFERCASYAAIFETPAFAAALLAAELAEGGKMVADTLRAEHAASTKCVASVAKMGGLLQQAAAKHKKGRAGGAGAEL